MRPFLTISPSVSHSTQPPQNRHFFIQKPWTSTLSLYLSSNSSAQHLCSEESTLGTLDDLLVDADGRVVHDNSAGLVVNLGVDAGIADEVDNPLLALVVGKSEAGGEVPITYRQHIYQKIG